MTQIFGYQTPHTILLATDSLALCPDTQGGWERKTVRKIVSLSPSVLMLSGGSGLGLALSHRFARVVRSQGLWDVESIFPKALPFARAQVASLRHELGAFSRPDGADVDRYYILLAGISLRSDPPSAHWMLLGAESHEAPIERIPLGSALAIPRHMGFEVQASRLSGSAQDLDTVKRLMEDLLRRRAEQSQDAAPPFFLLHLDANGIQERQLP
ncbi:hypothetical protein [Desulfosoma caldarium]|uniref:Uncharacterized protein n=1 Tax=Desulfosoma caldarium TaxID=610254 RepID=A0A3N1USR7_9BACT|nr:hypothetical protein [Desulfosoma caldarium]ROQ90156.1 hypothetical protein EDC27_2770 [Desulfosoma caldarium]